MGKKLGLKSMGARLIPTPFPGCVASDRTLPFSEPQFPQVFSEGKNFHLLALTQELRRTHYAEGLAPSRYSVMAFCPHFLSGT